MPSRCRVSFFETLVPTYQTTCHHIAEDHNLDTHYLENLFWWETIHYLVDEFGIGLATVVVCNFLLIKQFNQEDKVWNKITQIFQKGTYSTGDYVYVTALQSSRSRFWHFLHNGCNDCTVMILCSGSMTWNSLHSGCNSYSTKACFLELDNEIMTFLWLPLMVMCDDF
jgi:hypothetical protein